MKSSEIRDRFLVFFQRHGHVAVPSSSLIPDDPSVLLTTAGMQQFKKYYTGEFDAKKDFLLGDGRPALGTVSIQKSFRTSDIDEVGDERHLTFFEMMGNFSFGGYFKKEAISLAHEFITKEMGLKISYVTVFQGSETVPKDAESEEIWRSLGVKDVREEGMGDVFWGPTGTSGPCGPTTEIYCKNGAGQDIEVWNIVFNEFFCAGSREELLAGRAELKSLSSRGIDTGMGLERLAMVSQGTETVFETDLFSAIIGKLPVELDLHEKRVIADHVRAVVFLISDGVKTGNKGAGYILRRLLRRILVYKTQHHIEGDVFLKIFENIAEQYGGSYPDLSISFVLTEFSQEAEKFEPIIPRGIKEFERRLALQKTSQIHPFVKSEQIAYDAVVLHQSFGFPLELIKDLLKKHGYGIDEKVFQKKIAEEEKKHQEISRAGQEKKFGGHGLVLDTGELKAGDKEELNRVTRLHTATHLLHQALRDVLGDEARQMGSDITPERTRFDFAFQRKMTPDEVSRVERIVNEKISAALPVRSEEMTKEEAEKTGALHFFKEKYPDRVKVYFVGEDLKKAYSKEFCGGPHVANTKEIGSFKIIKEESVQAGVRRIRAVVN